MVRLNTVVIVMLVMMFLSAGVAGAAEIAGRLTNSTGTGIAGVVVTVYGQQQATVNSAQTDANGNYRISGLPADSYQIRFDTQNTGYASVWYGTSCPGAVLAYSTVFDASMVLESSTGTGTLTGRVTNIGGAGLSLVDVYAFHDGIIDYLGPNRRGTDANGDFSMTLPVGKYLLYFSPYQQNYTYSKRYLDEYYDDVLASRFSSLVTPVTIVNGGTRNVAAQLIEGGGIAGQAFDSFGNKLQGVAVTIQDSDGVERGTATTGSDGSYLVDMLVPGSYKVGFVRSSPTLTRWFGGVENRDAAMWVAASPGVTTNSVNVTFPGGKITGTTKGPGAVPLANVAVKLYDSVGQEVASTSSASDGTYQFPFVLPGGYKLSFNATQFKYYGRVWNGNKGSFSEAPVVTVPDGVTVVVDAALMENAGKIGGHVTNSSGTPLAGVRVVVYSADVARNMGTYTTDDAGFYQTGYLAPDSYKVYFNTAGALQQYDALPYLSEWYTDKPDLVQAAPVVLPASTVLGNVDAVLENAGSISGVVYDDKNVPIDNAYVTVIDRQTGYTTGTYANQVGQYTVYVPSGNYVVSFAYNFYCDMANYLTEYYSEKTSAVTANAVAVTAPAAVANINGTLSLAGIIQGNVRQADGTPVDDYYNHYYVHIFDPTGTAITYTNTYNNGEYRVCWMAGGQYKAALSTSYNPNDAKIMWYGGQADISLADTIGVTTPNVTGNVNFVILYNGSISGNVSRVTGCPPSVSATGSGQVCAYDAVTGKQAKCVYSDGNGNYLISYLPPGSYKVYSNYGYEGVPSRWYGGAFDLASALPVTVTSQVVTSGINIILTEWTVATAQPPVKGKLKFRVIDSGGSPIYSSVMVYNSTGTNYYTSFSGSSGTATLTPGNYKLRVMPTSDGAVVSKYLATWFDGKSDSASASVIQVLADTTTEVVVTVPDNPNLNYHAVTVSSTVGGTLSPAGSPIVSQGNSLSINFVPDPGNLVRDVKVDGISQGGISRYTFTNVSASHTVSVVFDTIDSDKVAPVISAFTVPAVVQTALIPIQSFSAADDIRITGWLVNESPTTPAPGDSGWKSTPPTEYTATVTAGEVTLYAWVKDVSGNVSAPATATVAISPPQLTFALSVSLAGSGSGSVNSNPAGIACTTGTCNSSFDKDASVRLLSTPSAGSIFSGWASGCSGMGDCVVTMDGDKSVTASFTVSNPIVKWIVEPPAYFTSLASAYTAAGAGALAPQTVVVQEGDFYESLFISQPVELTVKGGYDSTFTFRNGYSRLLGDLTVGAGSLVVDSLVIAPALPGGGGDAISIIQVDGSPNAYYSTFELAYMALQDGFPAVIRISGGTIGGGLNLNRDVTLSLLGGLDNTLTKQDGYLHLRGELVIALGSLTVDGIILE